MRHQAIRKAPPLIPAAGLLLALFIVPMPLLAVEYTDMNVLVVDAESGKPIYQARLTLQFRQPRAVGPGKPLAYSAKTNAQGKCKFQNIPKGAFRLMVTADHHQSFGKDYVLEKDNQEFEVKLKKPQPLL